MAFHLPAVLTRPLTRQGSVRSELIPQSRLAGPMPWVIAIMVALTVIASAAGLSLSNIARSAADELSGGITVQIVEANAVQRQRQAALAAERLKQTPGVLTARVVTPDEVDRLIEPWLGARGSGDDEIPVPALVDAQLRDPVNGETLGALRRLVREVAPAARVDAQSGWLKPVFGAIDSLRWLALALIVLLGFAMASAVLLAVRNALGANHYTIEIIHLLGGTDIQIARIFQRSVGIDAVGGGIFGMGIGIGVILLFGSRFSDLGAGLIGGGMLQWYDWVLLTLVPIIGAALAMITARLTVLRALQRML